MYSYWLHMQVEILGVSLPWRSIFTQEDSGSRFIEHINAHSKETNPFLSETDTNPFVTDITDIESKSFQPEPPANPLIDLLTGEILPDNVPQPITETFVRKESDIHDFLHDGVTQPHFDGNDHSKNGSLQGPTDNCSQQYIKSFKLLAGPHWVC